MNRLRRFAAVSLTLFLSATFAGAADILVDDFTDPLAHHHKGWMNTNTDYLTATADGGSLVLSNTSTEFDAEYYNTLTPKPSTFTISYVMESVTPQYVTRNVGSAGLLFCRSERSRGYQIVRYDAEHIVVYKWTAGGGDEIFSAKVPFNAADNKIMVSKSGSNFTVFVNDTYAGRFSDSQYASGDVAFMVPRGYSATIGDFRMTDQFTDGGNTSFSDGFDGNQLGYRWQHLTSSATPHPEISVGNGVMKYKTAAGGAVGWSYVDLELAADFVARVEVRHVAGAKNSAYGLFLDGGSNSQTVSFAIMGDRGYAAWVGSTSGYFSLPNTKIYGATDIGGRTYADTLMVMKRQGSNVYEFYVNNEHLGDVDLPVVSFPIVGVGVVVYAGLELEFDNFSVRPEGSSSIKDRPAISRRPGAAARGTSHVFYDLKGRKRYSTAAAPGRLPGRAGAAGVYVNENSREVRLQKDQRGRK